MSALKSNPTLLTVCKGKNTCPHCIIQPFPLTLCKVKIHDRIETQPCVILHSDHLKCYLEGILDVTY